MKFEIDQSDLTENEERIFKFLLEVNAYHNIETPIRVAGGWVRDKLLGEASNDIDIAVANMTGKDYCEKMNDYLLSMNEKTHKVAVIEANPDQSKHLETATMRIFGVSIDFVNLRCEDYSEDSRIPTMEFGLAEQDAYRRDLTINSLFYNINARLVEDFTTRGLEDLKNGTIATPLPAKKTFSDDPLRVLRAIRFDEDIKKAAACDDVRDKFIKDVETDTQDKTSEKKKISRERIGHEVDLMISGNKPVKAITDICDLQLFSVVFFLKPSTSEGCDRLCLACMDATLQLIEPLSRKKKIFDDEERRLSLYSALFLPLRKTTYKDKKPFVDYIFRSSLKLKVDDAQAVINIHNGSEKFVSLIPLFVSEEDIVVADISRKRGIIDVPEISKLRRILTGLLLDEIKGLWRVSLLMSTLLWPTSIDCTGGSSDFELNKRRELFTKVEDAILEMGLDNFWEVKPVVNGKDIISVLQLNSGGPIVSEWQKKLRQWQLANPSGTPEDCLDWMRLNNLKRVKG